VGDEFALSPKIRVKEIGGVSLVGLKFSMLSEELQSKIMEYELTISILRPLEPEERATVFFMRNQAAPLSKMDLSLVMLGEQAMDTFAELCNHDFMMNKIGVFQNGVIYVDTSCNMGKGQTTTLVVACKNMDD
jgi:hypothetical protein